MHSLTISRTPRARLALVMVLLLWPAACDTPSTGPGTPDFAVAAAATSAAAPSPLVNVAFGGRDIDVWPFTATDFSGTPVDPINLIFMGRADVRSLRAALVALDGNRTAYGFPAQAPFNCQWTDAIGGIQGAYSSDEGWTGSAIQLECGEYSTLRFHVRFFPAGDWTLANAHIDVLIPGTTDHEVLSWEIAEQFVTVDLLRTGLLDPAQPLGAAAGMTPSGRAIHPAIYNGLPAPLIALINGPPQPVAAPVPLPDNGVATILNLASEAPLVGVHAHQRYTLPFNQVIPKPFCGGPQDFVYVTGSVDFDQLVVMTPSGNYHSRFLAHGELAVTPIDPTAQPPVPIGLPYRALVQERYASHVTGRQSRAAMSRHQRLWAPDAGSLGSLRLEFRLDANDRFDLDVRCPN